MVRYPASAARHIFISGPDTIANDRPDKFGIRPILGRWSIPTWVYIKFVSIVYAFSRGDGSNMAHLDFWQTKTCTFLVIVT